MKTTGRYQSFKEFYPYYLTEHQNFACRVLHFIGTCLFFDLLILGLLIKDSNLFLLMPFVGYGFAWIGHFFFEKNKPATFQYPLYSLFSDFKLFFQLVLGTQSFRA